MNKLATFLWISCSLIMISTLSYAGESELAKLKNGFTKKVNSVLLPLVQRHKSALLNLEKSLANVSEVEQALLVREERLRISELDLIDLIGDKFDSGLADMLMVHYQTYSLTQDFLNSPPDDAFVVQIAPSKPLKSRSLMSDKEDLLHDYELGLEAGYRFVETYTTTENARSSHMSQLASIIIDK